MRAISLVIFHYKIYSDNYSISVSGDFQSMQNHLEV